MKKLFKKINADKIIKLGTYLSLGLILLHLIYIAIYYFQLPPLLPLYNQMQWGADRLGNRIEIFLPLLITISIFSLNLVLALQIYEKMPLISRILNITGLLISILTFIFIVQTIKLVI